MKINIIIPYKEDRGYLKESIDSVYRSIKDNNTYCLSLVKGNKSLSKNFNEGLRQAVLYGFEFVKMHHDDDLLTENALTDLHNAADGYDIVIANAINFTETSSTIIKSSYHSVKSLLADNTIHGSTVLYRTSALEAVGGMSEDLITGEEYDLNIRLLLNGAKLTYLDEVVCKYRIHDKQKSLNYLDFNSRLERKMYIESNIINKYR